MKILAIERDNPGLTPADFQLYLRQEAAALWQLVQSGIVRETYFDKVEHTAVLMLECSDFEEARRCLETLPLVEHSLIRFELIQLSPYDGFERLFSLEIPAEEE